MNPIPSPSPAARGTRSSILTAVMCVAAALVGVLGFRVLTVWASSASPSAAERFADRARNVAPNQLAGARQDALGEADGELPDGATVFDDEYPAVAKIDPDLLGALRRAASDAAVDGIEFHLNSGWRAPAYQQHLLDEAVSEYGSREEAARWVATADTSPHVLGDAVDLGPSAATAWLSEHGEHYGLCQIYANETWHYELRPDAVYEGCPPMYADPTSDPRMQR